MPRLRVYLTLSLRDAELLIEQMEGSEVDSTRLDRIRERLFTLTEAQRPNLAEGMFDGPPDDYGKQG